MHIDARIDTVLVHVAQVLLLLHVFRPFSLVKRSVAAFGVRLKFNYYFISRAAKR